MANSDPRSVSSRAPEAAATPRREYWRVQVEECRRSGLSQVEFCRRRGIATGTLSFWKSILTRGVGRGASPATSGTARLAARPAFVPVRITASRSPHGVAEPGGLPGGGGELEIILDSGHLVRVRGRVDAEWLGQVLGAVVATRC